MVLHVRGSTMLYEVQRRYFLVCVALAIPVVVQDGVKSMGYGDDCTLLKLFTNRLLDQGIGLHVNRRRRLVQHQDLGLPQQRSCQTHQLTLTHATNTSTHSVIVTSEPGSSTFFSDARAKRTSGHRQKLKQTTLVTNPHALVGGKVLFCACLESGSAVWCLHRVSIVVTQPPQCVSACCSRSNKT